MMYPIRVVDSVVRCDNSMYCLHINNDTEHGCRIVHIIYENIYTNDVEHDNIR